MRKYTVIQNKILKSVHFALGGILEFSDKESMVFPVRFPFEVVIISFSYFQSLLMQSVDQLQKVEKISGEKRELWAGKVGVYY